MHSNLIAKYKLIRLDGTESVSIDIDAPHSNFCNPDIECSSIFKIK